MSSTPLSQRRAPSATARFGGSGTVPTGRVQVVPSTHRHGAQVPLPVVRSPPLHAGMLIWDPGARERGAPSLPTLAPETHVRSWEETRARCPLMLTHAEGPPPGLKLREAACGRRCSAQVNRSQCAQPGALRPDVHYPERQVGRGCCA